MILSGQFFIYDGKSSEQYGLRILRLDTERLRSISGGAEYKTAWSRSQKRNVLHGIDWSQSALTQDIEFISEDPIETVTANAIKAWLFNRAGFKRLYSDPRVDETVEYVNGVLKREYVDCVFYSPQEIRFADGLHGYKATFLAATPMAVQEEVTYSFSGLADAQTITIPCRTDIEDYVYPILGITTKTSVSPVTVTLTNTSDANRVTQLEGIPSGTKFTMDCIVGTVLDNTHTSLYSKFSNRHFFRLVPGSNIVTVSGVADLTVRFENARWFL